MKIIRAKRESFEMVVPVLDGFRVKFESHLATVPDEVGEWFEMHDRSFYEVVGHTSKEALHGAKVLITRDCGLGDVLMVTPLIRALATTFSATVDVHTNDDLKPLFDGNPHVRAVFGLQSEVVNRADYDVPIDLRLFVENEDAKGRYRHRVPAFAQACDIDLPPTDWGLDYFVSEDEKRWAKLVLPSDRPLIGYVYRSSTDNRNWSHAQHARVLAALVAAGYAPVVIHHAKEKIDVDGVVNWTGATTVRQTGALLSQCVAVVAPDTGLFHMASAMGLPVIAYFGAMPISDRATHSKLTVLNNPEDCGHMPRGCRFYRCLNVNGEGQPRCLEVSPEAIVEAVQTLIKDVRQGVTHSPS